MNVINIKKKANIKSNFLIYVPFPNLRYIKTS